MIPNDPEYPLLRYSRMPPAQFYKGLLIPALGGRDQVII